MTKHFDYFDVGVFDGRPLRHEHGLNYLSEDSQTDIRYTGIVSSPAFWRQPEGNGFVEWAIWTLNEQLRLMRHFATIEQLRVNLAAFSALYKFRSLQGHLAQTMP